MSSCACDHYHPRQCRCGGSCKCHDPRPAIESGGKVVNPALGGEYVRRLALAVERNQVPAPAARNPRVMHDADCPFLEGEAACSCDPLIRVKVGGDWVAILADGTAVETDRTAWVPGD